jgi:hypothetical protein
MDVADTAPFEAVMQSEAGAAAMAYDGVHPGHARGLRRGLTDLRASWRGDMTHDLCDTRPADLVVDRHFRPLRTHRDYRAKHLGQ